MEIERFFVTTFGFLHGWCSRRFVAIHSSTFLDGDEKVCSESDDWLDQQGHFGWRVVELVACSISAISIWFKPYSLN